MKKTKTLLVIGLNMGEILGGIVVFVILPRIVGGYVTPLFTSSPEPAGWVWFFGLATIIMSAWVLFVLYCLIFVAIPAWILANQRLASHLAGEEKIYCHVCTEKSEDKDPVRHYPPTCKRKKRKE